MEPLTLAELKETELNILKTFDKICRKNNLEYSLAFGTMIGAIRHHGFIPWDDDIDVCMKRDDYEKLLSLKYSDENFEIKNYRYTKGYYYPFSKMVDKNTILYEPWRCDTNMGVYIDIFPLDSFDAETVSKQEEIIKKVNIRSTAAYLMGHKVSHHKQFSLRYFLKALFLIITMPCKKSIIGIVDSFCKNYDNGNYCGSLLQFYNNPFIKSQFFEKLINVEFEDIEAPVYAEYDAILTHIYGDYMTPPEPDKQVSNHYFTAYRKK